MAFIKELDSMGSNSFSDELLALAFNIEQALILAGAESGKDYTRLDLFKMAEPYMLEKWRTNDKIEYFYPAKEVLPKR